MLFPLLLTPFEEYMLADDRLQWPMTFFLRLSCRGEYRAMLLSSALAATIARHPLVGCLLANGERGQLQWVEGPGSAPPILECDADLALDLGTTRQIDLRREIGLRLWVRQAAPDRWTLWLQFHHACCDGLGAMQFVRDLMAVYGARLTDQKEYNQSPLDPQRLRRRGSFGLTVLRQLIRLPQELLGILGAIEFFLHRPPSLGATVQCGAETQPREKEADGLTAGSTACKQMFPRSLTHRFSREETERLRDVARTEDVTLNDLLLANLFSALDDWFVAHRPEARKQFLRVMVPTNLRSVADAATPAANIVSLVNLDRRPGRYKSPRKLLKSLSLEMAIIKRCRLGITMHHLARIARRFGKLSWLVRDDRCLSTGVLSNLGDITSLVQPGPTNADTTLGRSALEVLSLEFLPPIRPFTAASFGVLTFRDQLTITLHCEAVARLTRTVNF